jgi:hypothetical protein
MSARIRAREVETGPIGTRERPRYNPGAPSDAVSYERGVVRRFLHSCHARSDRGLPDVNRLGDRARLEALPGRIDTK